MELDKTTIRAACAQTIRLLRARQGLTQEGLAYKSGVDRGYMGAIERGRNCPTLETILRLLPTLAITFPEFALEFDKQYRKLARAAKKKS